jgi:hypothetical protein
MIHIEKFMQCPFCNQWLSSREVIESDTVEPMGLSLGDDDIEWNYYYFRHRTGNCGTTFTIPAEDFNPFLTESVPNKIRTGQNVCEGRCLTMKDHQECRQECHWAPYRRFLIRMKESRQGIPAQ